MTSVSAPFLSLIAIWIVALLSPGPDVIQVMRCASKSRSAGLACAVGVCIPYSCYVIIALAGLGAIVKAHPGIVHALQFFGGLYLLFMAYKIIRGLIQSKGSVTNFDGESMSASRAFVVGMATNASNPKALIFFVSVFTQFIGVASSFVIAPLFIFGGLVWFVIVASLVSYIGPWLRARASIIDGLAGTIFGAFGTLLLLETAKNI